jgi:hypothetical protein
VSLLARTEIAQATLDRFKGHPLTYGRHDCVQMAAFHLRASGYRVLLSKGGRYRSAIGAVRALRRAGYQDLFGALDDLGLVRIAPAAAIVGDIVALPSEEEILPALTIALGNGRVIGWHPDAEGAAVLQPLAFEAAWRVECRKS